MKLNHFIKIMIFTLMWSFSYGQENNTLSTDLGLVNSKYDVNTDFSIEMGRALEDGVESNSSSFYSGIRLTNKRNKNYGVIHLSYDRDLSKTDRRTGEVGELRDPVIEIGGPIYFVPNSLVSDQKLSLISSIGVSTSSEKAEKKSSLALKISYSIPVATLSIYQYHRLTRSFYTTEVTKAGSINNPWAYRLLNSLSYKLSKVLSISGSLIYDLRQSFQYVLKDGITTDIKMSYKLNKTYGLYAGLASVGLSTKEADGRTNRLKFYDDIGPAAYMGMSANF